MSGFTIDAVQHGVPAKEINRVVPIFLKSCEGRVKPKTLECYTDHLGYWSRFWNEFGPMYDHNLTLSVLQDFKAWLALPEASVKGSGLGPSTRGHVLKRMVQFGKWCHKHGYVDTDISPWVPSEAAPPKQYREITPDEICYLFLAASSRQRNKRLQFCTILAVLFSTGCRREECFEIKKENVKFLPDGSGRGTIYLAIAKGDKPRTVLFDAVCGAFLEKHLEGRGDGRIWDLDKASAIYFAVARLSERAGIPRVKPHDCRTYFASHYFATHTAADSYTRKFLEELLGHAAPGGGGNAPTTDRHYIFVKTPALWRWYTSPLEQPEVKDLLLEIAEFVEVPQCKTN